MELLGKCDLKLYYSILFDRKLQNAQKFFADMIINQNHTADF